MYKNLKIVKIDSSYCNYLRKFDSKESYNAGNKELRPFIGILFKVQNHEYFAPLSSPKEKHKHLKNTINLIKIKDGEYGVVNINNMIPVNNCNYLEFDFDKNNKDVFEINRLELLSNQLRWLTINRKELYVKSKLLYNLYKYNKLPLNVRNRCCNYPLLEEICEEYNRKLQEV